MASLGHTVEILTRRSSIEAPSDQQLAPGATLRFLDAGPARPVAKGHHEAFIDEFRMRMSALGPYDLIHSHHWFSGMAALPIARRQGIPHLQSFHSIAADESTSLSAGERAESAGRMDGEAWLARESDAVVAISAAEAVTVTERLGARPARVLVVPPGVDGALFHPAADVPEGRGYAVVAARLQPLKGLDLAIEAIAAVPAAIRPDLVIAGDASDDFAGYVEHLRALAAGHGITGSVRFVGPQSRTNLATLLRGARVVLIPSHSETFGLVALEGAASGVPVVAAASGGLLEAVVHGETGLIVATRDPADWADSISAILANPALALRLSLAARERAEHFDWLRSGVGLLAGYSTLLRPGHTGRLPQLTSV